MKWRRNRSQTCRRKRRHKNRKAAYSHLRELLRSDDVIEPQILKIYRCKECGFYHLGHLRSGAAR
jgi:hypothetical protein